MQPMHNYWMVAKIGYGRVRASRAVARVTAWWTVLLGMFLVASTRAYAQGTGQLGTKLDALVANLTTLGRPMAALALLLFLLSVIFEPALPGWAQENKKVIRGSMLSAMLLGAAPDIVAFFIA